MVGQRFISLLADHPWFNISILAASQTSAGKTYYEALNGRWVMPVDIPEKIKNMYVYDAIKDIEKIVSSVDFVFCAVNMKKDEIKILEEMYAKAECPVISNNSAHRNTPDVPMIIPEINPEHADVIFSQRKRLGTKKGFIAVKPNCSLQCYVPALHPLLSFGLKNVLVCTYQAISGAGKNFERWPEMVDNIIPYIDGEEEKSELEPLKIWGKISENKIINASLPNITTQCLRVPVTDGHTAAVFASFEKSFSLDEIIAKWNTYDNIREKINLPSSPQKFLHYFDNPSFPQIRSARELDNGMAISIGRLRQDSQYDVKFICMSHNTIRGAAGGAVLMAELLCFKGFFD